MCVRVYFEELTWRDARHVCRTDNADLVVPDTELKSLLLQQNLIGLDTNGMTSRPCVHISNIFSNLIEILFLYFPTTKIIGYRLIFDRNF